MSLPTGPILPSQDILNDFEHGKFVLSNLAAKRAKQLKDGAPPLVRIDSSHPLTIALAEIAAGKIRAILGKEPIEVTTPDSELIDLDIEQIAAERAILLPALDEAEASEFGVAALVADDHEHDEDHEVGPVASLEDLLDDADHDAEPVQVESEEDTLSLTDIEEQESIDEDEETSE